MKSRTALLSAALLVGFLLMMASYSPEPTQEDYAELLLDTAFAEMGQ